MQSLLSLPAAALAARTIELSNDNGPWSRKPHSTSVITYLYELHDAPEWYERDVLSASAIKRLINQIKRLLSKDDLIIASGQAETLAQILQTDFLAKSVERHRLHDIIQTLEQNFNEIIRAHLAKQEDLDIESYAFQFASHLLESGFSKEKINQELKQFKKTDLGDFLDGFLELSKVKEQTFNFILPTNIVGGSSEMNQLSSLHWISRDKVNERLKSAATYDGGYEVAFQAKDVHAAAKIAHEKALLLAARLKFSNLSNQKLSDVVYCQDTKEFFRFDSNTPNARLGSSVSLNQILNVLSDRKNEQSYESLRLDNALGMATALNGRLAAPAITGGWTALESLLKGPRTRNSTKYFVNYSAARIAAASISRAELTAISYQVNEKKHPDLANCLNAELLNRDRALIVQKYLWDETDNESDISKTRLQTKFNWRQKADMLAIERIRNILKAPISELETKTQEIAGTFDQLYRFRNIVAHGGAHSGRLINASLRVSTPIVGAVLDRITHYVLTEDIEISNLVARIEQNIGSLKNKNQPPNLVDLLEHKNNQAASLNFC